MKHAESILAHLQAGHSINHAEAQRLFNCDRLGARIHDLREAGYRIGVRIHDLREAGYRIGVREEPNVGKPGTHARYYLLKEGEDCPQPFRRRIVKEIQQDLFAGEGLA